MYNPTFSGRIGAELLLTNAFSVSLSVNGTMYYDMPRPLIFTGLAMMFNYVL